MKCEICKERIQETFLKKIVGTMIKDEKHKKRYFCGACQKKFKGQDLLKQGK